MTLRPVPTSALARIAGPALVASSVVGAVGLAFLAAMFASFAAGAQATGVTLGFVNDVTGIVTPVLAAPAVVVVGRLLRPRSPRLAPALTVVALVAMAAIVVLQSLLVARLVPFERQVLPVTAAMLVWGGWFVAVGVLGRRDGTLPVGPALGVASALYVGYPVWAWRVGRWLIVAVRPAPSGAERATA